MNDITGMNAHAQTERRMISQLVLHGHGAVYRIYRAFKFNQPAIAHKLDDLAAMHRAGRGDNGRVQVLQL